MLPWFCFLSRNPPLYFGCSVLHVVFCFKFPVFVVLYSDQLYPQQAVMLWCFRVYLLSFSDGCPFIFTTLWFSSPPVPHLLSSRCVLLPWLPWLAHGGLNPDADTGNSRWAVNSPNQGQIQSGTEKASISCLKWETPPYPGGELGTLVRHNVQWDSVNLEHMSDQQVSSWAGEWSAHILKNEPQPLKWQYYLPRAAAQRPLCGTTAMWDQGWLGTGSGFSRPEDKWWEDLLQAQPEQKHIPRCPWTWLVTKTASELLVCGGNQDDRPAWNCAPAVAPESEQTEEPTGGQMDRHQSSGPDGLVFPPPR